MELYHSDEKPQQICWDRKYYSTFEENVEALKNSKTVYVGNLSFFTTEMQIQGLFKRGPSQARDYGVKSQNEDALRVLLCRVLHI